MDKKNFIMRWKAREKIMSSNFAVLQPPMENLITDEEKKIIQRVWKEKKEEMFDGDIFVMEAWNSNLSGTVRPCKYSYHFAVQELENAKLAIGGHCLPFVDKKALFLVQSSGKLTVPGGAIDLTDAKNGVLRIEDGIQREMREELGFASDGEFYFTGIFEATKQRHIFFTSVFNFSSVENVLENLNSFQENQSENISGYVLKEINSLQKENLSTSALACLEAYNDMRDLRKVDH